MARKKKQDDNVVIRKYDYDKVPTLKEMVDKENAELEAKANRIKRRKDKTKDESVVLRKFDYDKVQTIQEKVEEEKQKLKDYKDKHLLDDNVAVNNLIKIIEKQNLQNNIIEEAQNKMEERKEELERVSQNTKGFEENIYLYDEEKQMQFQTKTEYGQAFYIGEVVEQALYEMCAVARTYSWTVPERIFFVEETVQDSKAKYGEKTFYNNLWNKQGETLEHCQTIVMSSKGQDVSRQVQRVKTLLLDIPYDEIEIDD